ncbi:unnamed protein product, partial [Brassica oleracea]
QFSHQKKKVSLSPFLCSRISIFHGDEVEKREDQLLFFFCL